MKIARSILFSIAFAVSLIAETYTDLDTAIRAVAATRKPMMAVVMQTTCPYCKRYWQSIINADGVFERLNRDFIIYESYLDRGGVYPSDMRWTGTVPTTYFITPNGEPIGDPLVGVIPLNYLLPYISDVLDYVYQSRDAYIQGGR